MDTDVLVVGAGPTGLMLANQLARRGVRVGSSTGTPGRRCRRGRSACRRARWRSTQSSASSSARSSSASAAPAPTCGRRAAGWRAFRSARPGEHVTPYPLHPHPRPGRQRADHGREAARARRVGRSGTPSWSASSRSPTRSPRRSSCRTARNRTITRRLGRRLRRRAQRRARAERHRLSRRALRARVLRRRCRGDRHDGARRGQRLPLARRLSPAVPDARQGSLAHRRHPAAGSARAGTTSSSRPWCRRCATRRAPDLSFKTCTWFSTYRIHHRARRALPRPPLLPARRRRAHPQPGRRAGHEHRPAGRLQSGLEAGAGRQGRGRRGAARHLRGGAPAGRAAAARTRPTARSGWSSPTAGLPACSAPRSSPGSPRSRWPSSASRSSRFAPSRRPASTTARARCRKSLDGLARRRAAARRSLPVAAAQAARRTARSRICSRSSTTRIST